MTYEISEIKSIRKKLGISQIELAKQASVSQSLIAKIESGLLDPTYSKAKKIFEVLDELSKHKELKAKDLMNKKLIFIEPETDIKDIIKEMRKHSISQMPVVKNDQCIGLISETILLDAFTKKNVKIASDIMGDIPPIIAKNTSINLISNLLRFYPIVIISEKGKLLGVITKADVLKAI
jgi:predicted transcriptional regulator